MKKLLLSVCSVLTLHSFAQLSYQEVVNFNVIDVHYSAFDLGDADNDGDLDIFIIGKGATGSPRTMFYKNDGLGNFSFIATYPQSALFFGTVNFADLDNDNDLDVLVTGEDAGGSAKTYIYENDGTGAFNLITNSGIKNVARSAVAIADTDNDGDLDVLVTGLIDVSLNIKDAGLFRNDGNLNFTEVSQTVFANQSQHTLEYPSIVTADFNNDGNADFAMNGRDASNSLQGIVFMGTGSNNFIYDTLNVSGRLMYSGMAVADFNNDGFPDLLTTGLNSDASIALLQNDGITAAFSHFTDVTSSGNFRGARYSSCAFSDPDNDGDIDITIMGMDSTSSLTSSTRRTIFYENDGTNNFSELAGLPFEGVRLGQIKYADVNNDGKPDVILSGNNNSNVASTSLYINTTTSTGIKDANINTDVLLYPNPATSSIFISGIDNIDEIQLLNVTGKVVKKLTTNDKRIVISDLKKGIYFVRITANNKVFNSRFIKE